LQSFGFNAPDIGGGGGTHTFTSTTDQLLYEAIRRIRSGGGGGGGVDGGIFPTRVGDLGNTDIQEELMKKYGCTDSD
jgi:hypothetical protein